MGGYYGFSPKFGVAGATAYGVFTIENLLAPGWDAHAALGLGLYKPKSEAGTFGFSAKAALSKRLNANTQLGLEGAYFNLDAPKYEFLTVGLYAKYYF